MRLLILGMLCTQVLTAAGTFYVCRAMGKVEDWPTPGNTHGVYTRYYDGKAYRNIEDAENSALETCRKYADYGCTIRSCTPYYEPGH